MGSPAPELGQADQQSDSDRQQYKRPALWACERPHRFQVTLDRIEERGGDVRFIHRGGFPVTCNARRKARVARLERSFAAMTVIPKRAAIESKLNPKT